MVRVLTDMWFDEAGATSIEYAMIASVVSIGIVGALSTMGGAISAMFTSLAGGF